MSGQILANLTGELNPRSAAASSLERMPQVDNRLESTFYHYSIIANVTLPVINNDTAINLAEYIQAFSIENDYTNMSMEIVKIVMLLPKGIAIALQEQYRETKINIALKVMNVTGDQSNLKYGTPEEVIPGKDYDIVHVNAKQYIDDTISEDLTTAPIKFAGTMIATELILCESSALAMKRSVINKVFNNVTMSDVLNVITTSIVKDKDYIIEEPDNNETYEQVFIPSSYLPEALEYLQAFYGIYENGIQSFATHEAFYITSRDVDILHGERFNNITLRVLSKTQDSPGRFVNNPTTFIDKKNKTVNITTSDSPVLVSGDVLSKEIIGANLLVGRDGKELSKTVGAGAINVKDDDKTRYVWLVSSSDYAVNEVALKINRSTECFKFKVANTDIRYLTPLSRFTLRYTYKMNSDASANYKIASCLSVFQLYNENNVKDNIGPSFTCNSSMRLERL